MNQKEILLISLTIFLTVIAWIIADLAHIANTKQIKITNPQVATKIETTIDTSIFTILKNKK
jgi:hypothetical protein